MAGVEVVLVEAEVGVARVAVPRGLTTEAAIRALERLLVTVVLRVREKLKSTGSKKDALNVATSPFLANRNSF